MEIHAAMEDPDDLDSVFRRAVEDNMLAARRAAVTGTYLIARCADRRLLKDEQKPLLQRGDVKSTAGDSPVPLSVPSDIAQILASRIGDDEFLHRRAKNSVSSSSFDKVV